MKKFGCIVLLFGGIIIGPIWSGFVLSIMWSWFMTRLGMPAITIPLAIGVSLIASLLTPKIVLNEKDEENITIWSRSLLYPLVILVFGYVVHFFV